MEPNITTMNELKHKSMKEKMMKKDSVNASEHDGGDHAIIHEDDKKKTRSIKKVSCGGAVSVKSCQADKCSIDLSDAKTYHRRHKVCEQHAKATVVVVAGTRQRFCQQCSRFHEVSEFDEAKRSCRRRLAGHNERRRKNPMDNTTTTTQPEGTSSRTKGNGQLKDVVCGQVLDDRRRAQIGVVVQENANSYKHFNVI